MSSLINKTMALTFWPGQNPMGRRYSAARQAKDWSRSLGRDDVKNAGLIGRRERICIYLPPARGAGSSDMYISHADSGGDRFVAGAVREHETRFDPSCHLADVRLMEDVLTRAQARPRFLTLLLSLFFGVALAIATVGIYGVVSYWWRGERRNLVCVWCCRRAGGDVLGLVMNRAAWWRLESVVDRALLTASH